MLPLLVHLLLSSLQHRPTLPPAANTSPARWPVSPRTSRRRTWPPRFVYEALLKSQREREPTAPRAKQTSAAEAVGDEEKQKMISLFCASCAFLLRSRGPPFGALQLCRHRCVARNEEERPKILAMREKSKVFRPSTLFRPQVDEQKKKRRCHSGKNKNRTSVLTLFPSHNNPTVSTNRSRPPSTRPSAPDPMSPSRSW